MWSRPSTGISIDLVEAAVGLATSVAAALVAPGWDSMPPASVTALGTAILSGVGGGNLVLILLGSYIAGSPAALGVAGSATNTGANPWVNERPRDRR